MPTHEAARVKLTAHRRIAPARSCLMFPRDVRCVHGLRVSRSLETRRAASPRDTRSHQFMIHDPGALKSCARTRCRTAPSTVVSAPTTASTTGAHDEFSLMARSPRL